LWYVLRRVRDEASLQNPPRENGFILLQIKRDRIRFLFTPQPKKLLNSLSQSIKNLKISDAILTIVFFQDQTLANLFECTTSKFRGVIIVDLIIAHLQNNAWLLPKIYGLFIATPATGIITTDPIV